MRLVQVPIPTGKRELVLDVLDEANVDYVVTNESGRRDYTDVVYFPLPTNAVERILEELYSAGLDEETYTVVLDANTVVSRHFEELEREYAGDFSEERIAREELQSIAQGEMPNLSVFVLMTVLSAIVATAGILLDSPAVVVGSMVIAPLVGPALAASVGTVIDDRDLTGRGVRLQIIGVVLAVISAAIFAMVIRTANLIPPGMDVLEIDEVQQRLAPDFLALAIALCAGVAGALSFSKGVSVALVGVMIAAALVPPAAVAGIGIAWGFPSVVIGSSVLLLVNVISINLAALAVLWYTGYRPRLLLQTEAAKVRTIRGISVLAAGVLVLSLFLGGVTYTSYQSTVSENEIRDTVTVVLDQPEYGHLTMIEVAVITDDRPLLYQPEQVIIVIGRPEGATSGDLADELQLQIQEQLGREIRIEIRYVPIERR